MLSFLLIVALLSAVSAASPKWDVCKVFNADSDDLSDEDAANLIKLFDYLKGEGMEVVGANRRRFLPATFTRLAEFAKDTYSELFDVSSLCKDSVVGKSAKYDVPFCFKKINDLRTADVAKCKKDLSTVEAAARWVLKQRVDAGKFVPFFVRLTPDVGQKAVTEKALKKAICSNFNQIPCDADKLDCDAHTTETVGEQLFSCRFTKKAIEDMEENVSADAAKALAKSVGSKDTFVKNALATAGYKVKGNVEIVASGNGDGAEALKKKVLGVE